MQFREAKLKFLLENVTDSAASKIVDVLMATRFALLLAKSFEDWDAYKLGVIDEKGEILIPKRQRDRKQEHAFTMFHKLIWNIKKLLSKVSSNVIVSSLAALRLIKESSYSDEVKQELTMMFEMYLYENVLSRDECLDYILEKKLLDEELTSTNTSGIAVNQPVMKKKKKKVDTEEDLDHKV